MVFHGPQGPILFIEWQGNRKIVSWECNHAYESIMHIPVHVNLILLPLSNILDKKMMFAIIPNFNNIHICFIFLVLQLIS